MKFIQKKGWLLRDFVIAGLVFGAVIALYIVSIASVSYNYDAQDRMISPSFAAHYSSFQEGLNRLNTSSSAVQGSSGLNFLGNFDVAFNSAFTVIQMIWDGIGAYGSIATNFTSDFTIFDSVPLTILMALIVASITAYIIFVWLSSVTRGRI